MVFFEHDAVNYCFVMNGLRPSVQYEAIQRIIVAGIQCLDQAAKELVSSLTRQRIHTFPENAFGFFDVETVRDPRERLHPLRIALKTDNSNVVSPCTLNGPRFERRKR